MIDLHGTVICGGYGYGVAYVFQKTKRLHTGNAPLSVTEESDRLEHAITAVKDDIQYCSAHADNDTAKAIFEIHGLMLEDEDFLSTLRDAILHEGITAEKSVLRAEEIFSDLFRGTQDDYMIARIDDIRDVCGRLLSRLSSSKTLSLPQEAFILIADELLPGDLLQFCCDNLKGILLATGTLYSHTSILIKENGIPALICKGIDNIKNKTKILINGDKGLAYIDPDCDTVSNFMSEEQRASLLPSELKLPELPFNLYVNIGNPHEVDQSLLDRCDGIGLFRTEYLFFNRSDLPDEEEQFSVYSELLKKSDGKPVTVRTFDIGSDKSVVTIPLEHEENPALGFRGLRVYSLYPEVFKTQLRALLRAAIFGDLRIMYPMVTCARELLVIRQILEQVSVELSKHEIPYRIPMQGAMIETPAAVLLSDDIAKTVDFFSVGTNDLAQYTFAVDRQDGRLNILDDHNQTAMINLIKIATENAHKNGIEIGICGELASLAQWMPEWIKLGIDSLSVSPTALRTFKNLSV